MNFAAVVSVALLAVFVPGAFGGPTASCLLNCTGDISAPGTCSIAMGGFFAGSCMANKATYTVVDSHAAKCNGNLGCGDKASIDACNDAASQIGPSCGGCIGTLIDCKDDAKCFPANATVMLQDGSRKTMAELEVGDSVQVGSASFSKVFMFSHRMTASESQSQFVSIATTAAAQPLQLSADHYLYVNGQLAAAHTVKVGDKLELGSGSAVEVTRVERVWGKGLYNPHTMTGDLIVNDIKTSCYTTAVHPTLAHAALWPVRAMYSAGVDIVNHAFDNGSELIASLMPTGPERIEA